MKRYHDPNTSVIPDAITRQLETNNPFMEPQEYESGNDPGWLTQENDLDENLLAEDTEFDLEDITQESDYDREQYAHAYSGQSGTDLENIDEEIERELVENEARKNQLELMAAARQLEMLAAKLRNIAVVNASARDQFKDGMKLPSAYATETTVESETSSGPDFQFDAGTSVLNMYGERGGERVTIKRDPDPADIAYINSFRRIPIHRHTKVAWEAMVAAARTAGFKAPLLMPTSGYRSFAEQKQLWEAALRKYGSASEARKWVAKPGGSAHQSGRAMDLHLGTKNTKESVPAQRKTAIYKWLKSNADKFGFYPYEAEPWHWEHNPLPGSASLGTAAVNIIRNISSGWASAFPVQTTQPAQPARTSAGIDPAKANRILSFEALARHYGKVHGLNPNIALAIIAAESGGFEEAGKGRSGYKGLMQAGTTDDHLKAETSIAEGIKKFIYFKDKILNPWLLKLGIDKTSIDEENYLKMGLSCYNAGPVTALKAIQYAHSSGGWQGWLSSEHYKRALLFSGGYAYYGACNKAATAEQIQQGKQAKIHYKFKTKHWRNEPDPPAWSQLAGSLPSVLQCWINTKFNNTPGYLNEFIRYYKYFENIKTTEQKQELQWEAEWLNGYEAETFGDD